MLKTIRDAWKVPELRRKLLFTLFIIVVFRIGSVITVPFLDTQALTALMDSVSSDSGNMLGYLNMLSGNAFATASLFALSITPYINASIIMQLLSVAIRPLERLAKEGEEGRKKLTAITRFLTVGLGLAQGTAYYFYLRANNITLYNEHAFSNGGFIAPMAVSAIEEDKRPNACIGCRSCEAVCPQQIKISEAMADFSKMLGL